MKLNQQTLISFIRFCLFLGCNTIVAKPITFEVTPTFQQSKLVLNVSMSFVGDVDGETTLVLPNEFGGQQHLYRCIRNITCLTKECNVIISGDSLFVRVKHKQNQSLKITYDVIQDSEGGNISDQNAFRPILQPTYFHIYGSSLFLYADAWKTVDVTIIWKNFPRTWMLHNSFGSKESYQQFHQTSPQWLESVFVGGDFRIKQTMVNGQPVFLAIRGNDWCFKDIELIEMLRKTVEVQRGFWNDFDIPYYTVTLLPLSVEEMPADWCNYSYLGTGLLNSFSAFASPTKCMDVKNLTHLFNHELMHDWIGSKIRNGGDMNDMTFGWFSEGFTEYFAYKNMLSAGFLTTEAYVDIINKDFFEALYSSPVADVPNTEIIKGFFKDPKINDLTYKRGFVFALFLDYAIQKKSGDLMDLHGFMLDIFDYYYESDRTLGSDFDFFEKNLEKKYLKQMNFEALFQRHIIEGKLIPAEVFELPSQWSISKSHSGIPILNMTDDTAVGK